MGRRKLVVYGLTVETAIFVVMREEGRGRVKIVTLSVGVKVKEEKRGGGGKPTPTLISSLFPPPTPLLLTRPIFSSIFEFQRRAFASKTFARPQETPALQARLFCFC